MTESSGVIDESNLLRTSVEIARQYRRSEVLPNDLIISIGPSYGKVMIVPPSLAGANLTQGTARCAPNGLIDSRWLFWSLQSSLAREFWATEVAGGTFAALNLGPLGRTPVPLASRDNQGRIADFLDDQVARINNIVAAREKQVALQGERFEVERELEFSDPNVPERPLSHLTDATRPINYGVLMPGPRLESGIPLIEAGDVMRGPIIIDELRLTDPIIEMDYIRSRLRVGDLVMAIRGSVGAVQRVPEFVDTTANVTRDAARISIDSDRADAGFVRHAIMSRGSQEWLRVRTGGSAVTGINIGDLRKLPVPLPAIGDQKSAAIRLDLQEAEVSSRIARLRQSVTLLHELKRSLITAAVTGEFDVATADGSQVPV